MDILLKISDFLLSFCDICFYGCSEKQESKLLIVQPTSQFIIKKPNSSVGSPGMSDTKPLKEDSLSDSAEFSFPNLISQFSFDNFNLDSLSRMANLNSEQDVPSDVTSQFSFDECEDYCVLNKLITIKLQLTFHLSDQTLTVLPSNLEPIQSKTYISLLTDDVVTQSHECDNTEIVMRLTANDDLLKKSSDYYPIVCGLSLIILLFGLVLFSCIKLARFSFDQFVDIFTDCFNTSSPPPSGIYVQRPLRTSGSAILADDVSSFLGENFNADRRRSTSNLLTVNTENVSKERRSTLSPGSIGPNQLKYLALYNSKFNPTNKGDDFGFGSITISVNYHIFNYDLQILVEEAKNLPSIDTGGECDPYLKISIYPGNFGTLKTKTHYKTRNPNFNETKVFHGLLETNLKEMTLNVKLFDWNRLSSNRVIGEINFSLGSLAECQVINNKKTIRFEKNIQPIKNTENYLGMLLVSLYLDMAKQQLVVAIIKGKDLKAMDRNKFSDPYCSIKLYTSITKLGTRKTSVKNKTLNPDWNESFAFNVTQKDFSENITLRIKVFDKDPVGRDVIGDLKFSSTGSFTESKHWKMMISNQKETLAEWHSIKSCG